MRKVIKQFDALKKKFSSKTVDRSMKIDLPGDLSDITIPSKVDGGELTITKQVVYALLVDVDRQVKVRT
jgi:hypothetical protein